MSSPSLVVFELYRLPVSLNVAFSGSIPVEMLAKRLKWCLRIVVVLCVLTVLSFALGAYNFHWPTSDEAAIPLALSVQVTVLSLLVVVVGILLTGVGISRLQLIEEKAVEEARMAAKTEARRLYSNMRPDVESGLPRGPRPVAKSAETMDTEVRSD